MRAIDRVLACMEKEAEERGRRKGSCSRSRIGIQRSATRCAMRSICTCETNSNGGQVSMTEQFYNGWPCCVCQAVPSPEDLSGSTPAWGKCGNCIEEVCPKHQRVVDDGNGSDTWCRDCQLGRPDAEPPAGYYVDGSEWGLTLGLDRRAQVGSASSRVAALIECHDHAEEVTAEADAEIERLHGIMAGDASLVRMNYAAGSALNMALSHPMVLAMANAFGNTLRSCNAENYIETRFVDRAEDPPLEILVTIQRVVGQTPHQLRRQAEAERDEARAAERARIAAWMRSDLGADVVVMAPDGMLQRNALADAIEELENGLP